jgi:hypothetical protein
MDQSNIINKKINRITKCYNSENSSKPYLYLYNIWVKYKSNFGGDNYSYLEESEITPSNDETILNIGDMIQYVPENKNSPHYKMWAEITDIVNVDEENNDIVLSYNIKFINPPVVNGELFDKLLNISEKHLVKNNTLILTECLPAPISRESLDTFDNIKNYKDIMLDDDEYTMASKIASLEMLYLLMVKEIEPTAISLKQWIKLFKKKNQKDVNFHKRISIFLNKKQEFDQILKSKKKWAKTLKDLKWRENKTLLNEYLNKTLKREYKRHNKKIFDKFSSSFVVNSRGKPRYPIMTNKDDNYINKKRWRKHTNTKPFYGSNIKKLKNIVKKIKKIIANHKEDNDNEDNDGEDKKGDSQPILTPTLKEKKYKKEIKESIGKIDELLNEYNKKTDVCDFSLKLSKLLIELNKYSTMIPFVYISNADIIDESVNRQINRLFLGEQKNNKGLLNNKKPVFVDFYPTNILAKYTHEKAASYDMDALSIPSANQRFKVREAKLVKHENGRYFDFKKSEFFDYYKKPFKFDIVIEIELNLEMIDEIDRDSEEYTKKSTGAKILSNVDNYARKIILNTDSVMKCNKRKQEINNLMNKTIENINKDYKKWKGEKAPKNKELTEKKGGRKIRRTRKNKGTRRIRFKIWKRSRTNKKKKKKKNSKLRKRKTKRK